jgi:hypothetical protein
MERRVSYAAGVVRIKVFGMNPKGFDSGMVAPPKVILD